MWNNSILIGLKSEKKKKKKAIGKTGEAGEMNPLGKTSGR